MKYSELHNGGMLVSSLCTLVHLMAHFVQLYLSFYYSLSFFRMLVSGLKMNAP